MSHQYDPEEVADKISDVREGDRVELVWQSNQSHGAVDATGVVRDDHEWDFCVETDDRTLVAHVEDPLENGDPVMLSSVYDDARTSLGDLVDVRVRERGEESLRADPLTNPETTADLDVDAETIVLVGCGDAKADEPRPARELYTSNYFSLKRQYAEEYGDDWAILSAEHGLLDPDVEIEPYDTTIDDVDRGEWEIEVLKSLSAAVKDTRVVLLAGPDYIDGSLEGDLFMYGADVETPTDGMRIGERMSWLSDEVEDDVVDSSETEEVVASDGGDADETPAPTEEPTPPESAPKYLREGLGKQDPDTLREIAAYADRLAEYKQAETERELEERSADVDEDDVPEEWDSDEWEETLDSTSAPSGATLTIKTIDDRDYYYYQWRDGAKIKSEYVAPVDPANND